MARTGTSVTVLMVALAALTGCGRAFFLPSFGSSSSSTSNYKKPDMWTTHEFGQYALGGHALPLAVPYPVPVPAAAPLQMAHAPLALSAQPQAQPLAQLPLAQFPPLAPVPGVGGAAAALYQSMQLVPCLCSVPKEDVEDAAAAAAGNSVAVTAAGSPQHSVHAN